MVCGLGKEERTRFRKKKRKKKGQKRNKKETKKKQKKEQNLIVAKSGLVQMKGYFKNYNRVKYFSPYYAGF